MGDDEEKGTEALVDTPKGALVAGEMTGAEMRARLAVLGDQKEAFKEFLKEQMKPGEHFYSMAEIQGRDKRKGDKDVLNKPGSALLANLFKTYAGYPTVKEEKIEGGDPLNPHYTITVTCALYLLSNHKQVAEGVGSCTTLEEKFAYRWVFENLVPKDLDKSTLKMQARTSRQGKPYKVFRLDNEELGSLHNTILKMAKKRAKVDATLDLPFASEIFTQDLEESHEDDKARGSSGSSGSGEKKEEGDAPPPSAKGSTDPITGPQDRMIKSKFRWLGYNDAEREACVKELYKDSEGHVSKLLKGEASEMIDHITKDPDFYRTWIKTHQEKAGKK